MPVSGKRCLNSLLRTGAATMTPHFFWLGVAVALGVAVDRVWGLGVGGLLPLEALV